MDELWRMGMPSASSPVERHLPLWQPAEETLFRRRAISSNFSGTSLDADDFTDVFGGPPRTVQSRHFSGGHTRASSASFFYQEIFRLPENVEQVLGRNTGRNLPEFRIPAARRRKRSDNNRYRDCFPGLSSDILASEDESSVRSRSRSKTSSSEDVSPLQRTSFCDRGDDVASSFSSRIRPMNVRSDWAPTRTRHENDNENINSTFGLGPRNTSPETLSFGPLSNGSFIVSPDDLEVNSLSSPLYSVCQERNDKAGETADEMVQQDTEEDEDGDDEVMSSYFIEINSHNRERTCEAIDVDEAIAWAKEKFQMHCKENKDHEKQKLDKLNGDRQSGECMDHYGSTQGSLDATGEKWAAEETEQFQSNDQEEMEMLDIKIKLWVTGNEADIRLLLSTLHHILWPNSGWNVIPLTTLVESWQVKKAYQKARLCLHPDKLQQRGAASLPQKFVAEKAFSVLQDAWAAFVSQDGFFR